MSVTAPQPIAGDLPHWDTRAQLKQHIGEIVSGVIALRSFRCNMLVYGCGYDTPFWAKMNRHGNTVFVEHNRKWARKARGLFPDLSIIHFAYEGVTVEDSLTEAGMERAGAMPMPPFATAYPWDIIFIDGPPGHNEASPGRLLPILWASRTQTARTHVFVDDYNRDLERIYCDRLLADRKDGWAILPSHGRAKAFWRFGTTLGEF